MNAIEAKILAIFVTGFGSLTLGVIPAFLTSTRTRLPLFLSCLLCFGAGVLMSTSLVHMLPEIRLSLTDYKQYAEVVFCAGFFLLYLVDEIMHFFWGSHHKEEQTTYGATENDPLLTSSNSLNDPEVIEQSEKSETSAPVGSIGLLIALLIHATLEGLAVGLQTTASQVLVLLAAISVHKFVIAFCLGIELKASGCSKWQHINSIIIFVIGSVSGIFVGMLITEVPNAVSEIVFPVLKGLAAGTLLYVTVSEVLPRERARWHKGNYIKAAGIIQFSSVILGFISMTEIIFCFAN